MNGARGAKLAVSVGCPSGIGPEVSVVAAAKSRARVLLVGDVEVVRRAAKARRVSARIEVVSEPAFVRGAIAVWQPTRTLAARDRELGRPSAAGGAAQLAWIDAACDLVSSGGADALVTGPVSKDAIASSAAITRDPAARQFLGHTEHLERRLGAHEVVMAFASESLVTALVSTHVPISAVPRAVNAKSVATATFWLADFLARTRKGTPRVAVAALNPHAGEHGRIGRDETRIAAGIARAKERIGGRAEVVGPIPAETAFRLAVRGEWDGVVAMYHDQATIPMKLLGFGEAVNVTLGLPIVRTSVDHGTAYDRAARFDADPRGMVAAMDLAARLS